MIRRCVALLLLCFVAIGNAEGVLSPVCDIAAEMEERVAEGLLTSPPGDDSRRDAAEKSVCHCAHAHVQTLVAAERTTRVPLTAPVAPIAFAESAPPSADRATPLRPPRA